MRILSFIYLLASSSKLAPGNWAGTYFDAIRAECIGKSGVIASMAMSIACILIVFNFIKLYYDFVSDEQNGGFGGAKAWDILRPFVILLLIGTFSTWLGLFDGVCSSVSSALISNMNAVAELTDNKIQEEIDRIDEELDRKHMSRKEKAHAQALNATGLSEEQLSASQDIVKDAEKQWRKTKEYRQNQKTKKSYMSLPDAGEAARKLAELNEQDKAQMKAFVGDDVWETYEAAKADVDTFTAQETLASERLKSLGKLSKWIGSGGSLLGKIITWLFNIFLVLMMVFSDVTLCVMSVFGPLTLALSIIPTWNSAFSSWMGKYIEVSMWKPVASAIAWVVLQARAAIFSAHGRLIEGVDMASLTQKASITAAIGVEALVLAAGIFALLRTPAITNEILSLTSGMRSAQEGAAAMAGAVGGVAGSAAGRVAGGAAQGARAAGQMAGSVASGAVQGVRQGVGAGFGARVGALDGLSKIRGK